MAIANLQQINIGQPNNPANSDSLYTAFNVIQNNFNVLANTASPITSIVGGGGINVVSNTTTATITNTGVTQIIAGTGISPIGGGTGVVTINIDANALANASNITAGIAGVGVIGANGNLTTSPAFITGPGANGNFTLDLKTQTGFTAGQYTNPTITVGRTGIVTAISNGNVIGLSNVVLSANGAGLEVSSNAPANGTQSITIRNTGVTSLTAGAGIELNASNGAVTISATGGGGGSGGGVGTVTGIGIRSNTGLAVTPVSPAQITTNGYLTVDLPNGWTWNNALVTTSGTNYMNVAGNVNAGNINATGLAGTLLTAAQPNITSIGTLSNLIVTSNINAGNVIASGTLSATSLTVTGGTATLTAATISTANIGNLTVTGPTQVTSLTANNIISTNSSGTFGSLVSNTTVSANGNISTTSGAFVAGVNFSAFSNGTVQANAVTVNSVTSGNVTTTANLISSGVVSFVAAANVSLGAVGNLRITGGSNGQVLSTDGNGILSWANVASSYGNANVANYLPNYGGNIGNSNASGASFFTSTLSVQDITFANSITSLNGDISGVDVITANTFNASNATTTGNLNVTSAANVGGILRATSGTASSSNTSGALVVTGGIGVSGNANIGGTAFISGALTANANVFITGNSIMTGNVDINNQLNVQNAFFVNDDANIAGNLIVSGGSNISLGSSGNVSITAGGNLTIDAPIIGTLDVQGNTTLANVTINRLNATVTANSATTVGNVVTININGTTYQLLAR